MHDCVWYLWRCPYHLCTNSFNKTKLNFCAGWSPAWGMSEICNDENFWKWSEADHSSVNRSVKTIHLQLSENINCSIDIISKIIIFKISTTKAALRKKCHVQRERGDKNLKICQYRDRRFMALSQVWRWIRNCSFLAGHYLKAEVKCLYCHYF